MEQKNSDAYQAQPTRYKRPLRRASELTASEVRAILSYDPVSGTFCSLASGQSRKVGFIDSQGYVQIYLFGRYYGAHRLAWFHAHGRWPRDQVDHINGDRTDNRLCNLREVTPHQNRLNKGMMSTNTSGLKGVYSFKGRWKAQIQFQKKSQFLGMFDTKEEAHAAYTAASRELFGEFHRDLSRTSLKDSEA